MENARLRLSTPLMAAIACLLAYYGGYTTFLLFAGYVFLKEKDQWLENFCIKTLLLMFVFSVASTAINLIPNLLGVLYDFLGVFRVSLYLRFPENVCNFFGSVLSVIKTLVFLGWTYAGLKQKSVKITMVDKFLNKHLSIKSGDTENRNTESKD